MLSGSIVALITPMQSNGTVCTTSLCKLVNYHIANGTSAIVSVGTTGESATFNLDEHVDVVKLTVEYAAGRIPVIAGTGANCTREAIALTQRVERLGVVGCLSVTPYYNRPTQEGLYLHYKAIAESTSLPQILYNVPARTGCDLLPQTVARLAEIDSIVGIKEATGNLARVSQIQQLIKRDFALISGDDATALDFMKLGGHGVISVTANVAARQMADICALAQRGDFALAQQINQLLMPLHQQLFCEANPIPVKWAAQTLGLIADGTLRLPMTPLSTSKHLAVINALQSAGLK